MAQQKVRADLIIRALAKRHDAAKDLFIAEVKNGPTIYGEHRIRWPGRRYGKKVAG